MKTLFISTHDDNEYNLFLPSSHQNFIDNIKDTNRIIVIKNQKGTTLPKLVFGNDEKIILLHHGEMQNVLDKYKSVFSFRYNCGTLGNETTVSDNRKMYQLLLNKKFDEFNVVWNFFFDFVTEQKLQFLHSIFNGKILNEIPEILQNDEINGLFKSFNNKRYDNDNANDRVALTNLRDAVLKIK